MHLEPEFEKLSDAELRAKTDEFKARIAEATKGPRDEIDRANQELEEKRKCEVDAINAYQQEEISRECKDLETQLEKREDDLKAAEKRALDEILPEAFAAVREAAKRTIHQRHFDVQLIGGIVLHQGKIAEMRTGEGKTLVATCPLYLNSLTGRGVHLITVNDYLARRDPYWMGPIYHALGVSVASIYPSRHRMSICRPDFLIPNLMTVKHTGSISARLPVKKLTRPISPTAPAPNSALIICETIW